MISDLNKDVPQNNKQTPVYLNIYDFWSCFNCICQPIGLGVYHTGIQLFDDEYMFFGFDGDQTGVGYIEPFSAAYHFSEQILLGYTSRGFFQFDEKVLDPLRLQFTGRVVFNRIGNKYDLLANNCNHFSKRLAKQLGFEQKFPKKIFRITDFCNLFRFCIPQCILNGRLDWFYSNDEDQYGYEELQQSVKQQDIKMISSKSNKNGIQQIQIHQKISQSKVQYVNLHHDVTKNTTLRKGIWPHTEHLAERSSKMHSARSQLQQIHHLPQLIERNFNLSDLKQNNKKGEDKKNDSFNQQK